MSKHTEGSYKGKPTLTLDADSKWPFTFGITKAQLIVEDFEIIKAFVAKHGKTKPAAAGPRDPGEDQADRDSERMGR